MQQKNKRCAYKKITEDIRRQIIGMFQAQESLKEISKVVGLNVSTCKGIIKVFQEQGRIGKKLQRKRPIRVIQTYSFFEIDQGQIKRLQNSIIQDKQCYVDKNKNIDQLLLKQSQKRAEQYLNKWVQSQNTLGETNIMQLEHSSNCLQWQNNQTKYQNHYPGLNWFMPFQYQ